MVGTASRFRKLPPDGTVIKAPETKPTRGVMQSGAISGYTGHLPGAEQSYGVNFGIQKKITSGLLTNERTAKLELAFATDKWGNASQNDPRTKPTLTNSYLQALHPEIEVDYDSGVGRTTDMPPVREPRVIETDPTDILANFAHPFKEKIKPTAPPRIVGYLGHRGGACENDGESFNRVEMRDPEYAKKVTYSDLTDLDDFGELTGTLNSTARSRTADQ